MASEKQPAQTATMTPPVPYPRLKEIAHNACKTALENAEYYDHAKTESWNTQIINSILRSLISETAPSPSTPPSFKYAVNSTIIQHLLPNQKVPSKPTASSSTSTGAGNEGFSSTSTDGPGEDAETKPLNTSGSSAQKPSGGRRGMHSATGAYWNNERDGMWSFKFEDARERGMDVVISVIWIAV